MQQKQNITLKLDKSTLRKARLIAARKGMSMSRLLATRIEELISETEAYEAAQRTALEFLERGFHLGGKIRSTRDAWHER